MIEGPVKPSVHLHTTQQLLCHTPFLPLPPNQKTPSSDYDGETDQRDKFVVIRSINDDLKAANMPWRTGSQTSKSSPIKQGARCFNESKLLDWVGTESLAIQLHERHEDDLSICTNPGRLEMQTLQPTFIATPVVQVPLKIPMVMIEAIQLPLFARQSSHPAALLAVLGDGVECGAFLLEVVCDGLEVEIEICADEGADLGVFVVADEGFGFCGAGRVDIDV